MLEEADTGIGGLGVILQLDETRLGKKIYQRGHQFEGIWMFAGIEMTVEQKGFLRRVDDRSAATLEAIIHKICATRLNNSYRPLEKLYWD
jgi:hypothetical protein